MYRRYLPIAALLILLPVALLLTGLVTGQGEAPPERIFEVYRQIGDASPQGLRYNRAFDQYAMINIVGELVLVQASTFEQQFVLYPAGANIVAYRFSNNGRWLALAIDRRIEIWDTQTGTKSVEFEPDGALAVQRPLFWSDDDELLAFEAVIRAPQAIRRSENDTSILPWLWDVAAARRERGSRLPGRVEALPFFENRGGVVLGPHDTLITAIAERLQIQKFDQRTISVTDEVITGRAETDPLLIYRSLNDEWLYIFNERENSLVQVNTRTGKAVDVRTGRSSLRDFIATPTSTPPGIPLTLDQQKQMQFTAQTTLIGEPHTVTYNSLTAYLLGEDYQARYSYHPLTVMLVDLLRPVTLRPDQYGFLVYVRDEQTGEGVLHLVPEQAQNLVLSPDEQHLLIRRTTGDLRLEAYDLDSGALLRTYLPDVRTLAPGHVLDYNADGTAIITDWQRFDAATGAVITQDLRYFLGFDNYYWSDAAAELVTTRGDEWFRWDIASRRLLSRTRLEVRGSLVAIWQDGKRYLSINASGDGVEVYYPATGDRRTATFEQLTGRSIVDIVASPDWEHYLVRYSADTNSAFSPGEAVAIYSLSGERLWLMSDADLPAFTQYGWLDNQRIYLYQDVYDYVDFPARVYGADYAPSGLPACLVEQFPDTSPQWADAWERFTYYLPLDFRNNFTLRFCAALAENSSEATVNAFFTPSPTPERTEVPYASPTPVLVAGVPACLTQRFPAQALAYADDWRRITADLTPAQISELETLLCENLSGSDRVPEGVAEGSPVVMTVDLNGVRSTGAYIPARERTTLAEQPVYQAFERVERRGLNSPKLSPDGQYVAELNFDGTITVWRITRPYASLVDDVTATVAVRITEQNLIAVRPTETPDFAAVGTARPTFTPTMTVTAPPRPDERIDLVQRDSVEEVCIAPDLYTSDNPPPDWNPPGWLIVRQVETYNFGDYLPTVTPSRVPRIFQPTPLPTIEGATPAPTTTAVPPTPIPTFSIQNMPYIAPGYDPVYYRLSPVDGTLIRDERIPRCADTVNCDYSYDQSWLTYDDGSGLYLARPDGSAARQLVDYTLNPVYYEPFVWIGRDLLQTTIYQTERDPDNPVRYAQRIIAGVTPDPEPTTFPSYRVNDLPTSLLTDQPGAGPLAVVYTTHETGSGEEFKFYIYDTRTATWTYFARYRALLEVYWHPDGEWLFYAFPSNELQATWYVYDTVTQTHREYGKFPDDLMPWSGDYAPNGRLTAYWTYPSNEEIARRREAEEPLPKLSIYNLATGAIRRYCLPQTEYELLATEIYWSPDSRYISLPVIFPAEALLEIHKPHLLILDTVTGAVMDLGFDVGQPVIWTADWRSGSTVSADAATSGEGG